jgi:hypothetical protein
MRLVSFGNAFGTLVRVLTAAALVAVVAVGAPMHSHDVGGFADGDTPQMAPCAACVSSASPGLVLACAEVTPRLEPIGVVSTPCRDLVPLPVAARSGRAPPTV